MTDTPPIRSTYRYENEVKGPTETPNVKPSPPTPSPIDNLCNEVNALRAKIAAALEHAKDGQYDGAHHKMWAIDQIVRALTGDQYTQWVDTFCSGEDGPDTYAWDVGIPP